jgi:SOS-response transcriptional repressor LexA
MEQFENKIISDNFIVEGDSMKDCGLRNGMVVKINRSKIAKDNNIVVVKINGKLFIKELRIINGKVEFHSKNKKFENITEFKEYQIIGVVESFFES